jgi:hypothetical protein
MKDSITLQGRTYECTKLIQQRFGLDDQTLREWAKNNIVPSPVRLGNKCFYDWEAIESRILARCQEQVRTITQFDKT